MTAFVLGNGVSRQNIKLDQLTQIGDVYGCNALYRTFTPRVLVATDTMIAEVIQKSGYSLHNRFYTRQPLPEFGALPLIAKYRGYSSGPNAVSIAAQDGHRLIFLLGFDMGPADSGGFNNVYADTEFYKKSTSTPTYTGNWIRQLCTVFDDFSATSFVRVMGKTTADVAEFSKVKNLEFSSMSDFENRINTIPKDL
jgi:hypothetical protein